MNHSAFLLVLVAALPVATVRAAPPDPFSIAPPTTTAERMFAAAERQTVLVDKVHNGLRLNYAPAGERDARMRLGTLAGESVAPDPFGLDFSEHSKRFLSSAEFEQKMGRAVGIVSVGMLRESGSMLVGIQGRPLALNTSPTTTFTSISAGYALTANSAVVAMASSGRTAGFGSADSLISQVSAVRTVAYSVGFSSNRILSQQDRIGLTFSIPARVKSGDIQLTAAPNGVNSVLGFGSQTLNLRPTATERDTELSYSSKLGRDGRYGKVTGAVMWRVNPGHDAMARPDWLIGVRYGVGF